MGVNLLAFTLLCCFDFAIYIQEKRVKFGPALYTLRSLYFHETTADRVSLRAKGVVRSERKPVPSRVAKRAGTY